MLWLDGKCHIALSTFQHCNCLLVSKPFQTDTVYCHNLIPSMKLSTMGCCSFLEHSFDVDWQITMWAAVPSHNAEPQSIWSTFQHHSTCLKLWTYITAPGTKRKNLHSTQVRNSMNPYSPAPAFQIKNGNSSYFIVCVPIQFISSAEATKHCISCQLLTLYHSVWGVWFLQWYFQDTGFWNMKQCSLVDSVREERAARTTMLHIPKYIL